MGLRTVSVLLFLLRVTTILSIIPVTVASDTASSRALTSEMIWAICSMSCAMTPIVSSIAASESEINSSSVFLLS